MIKLKLILGCGNSLPYLGKQYILLVVNVVATERNICRLFQFEKDDVLAVKMFIQLRKKELLTLFIQYVTRFKYLLSILCSNTE